MTYREVIKNNGEDLNSLADLLGKFVNAYRLLIAGAGELNTIALSKKNEVKDALDRAEDVGAIIDDLVKIIESSNDCYFKYMKIKNDFILSKTEKNVILTEINKELDFQNYKRCEDDE
ncbi:hypothetical protein [Clostridium gasigenes]|uniref:Uncharacterized protein n=1 Tax=Clostridium gasigenes TaxID=94869 RepID=A0A7X0VT83_9CLOT|nr:hypothetical protein [Clostridium gasigenes]MBB6716520.1 hypothetical protein [Clostridium gasigenes]MBU3108769.1 hypothetical protein [Clostridium gasigenes]